ncbi:MAG: hypothetical protein Q9222_003076, partial [Ikaeria aurantiellina]
MARKGSSRAFKEVKIFAAGHQSGASRYPKSPDKEPPSVASFRNNLVAFSQYYNLCFVASQDRILVHVSAKAGQQLSKARLSIALASSGTGLIGYIDAQHSHAINHLVVADLGFEEIVLAVCDDGDVIAYTTRSIQHGLEQVEPTGVEPLNDSTFRPCFVNNVGMSAWGAAVHKEARMIAVSSNSRKIHVFAYALVDPRNKGVEGSSLCRGDEDFMYGVSEGEWLRPCKTDPISASNRFQNLEIILSSHRTNIPNVAFYNAVNESGSTSPWTEKAYLASTDIDGITYIWDVWERSVIAKLTTSMEHLRGWGVACIDSSICRQAESDVEAFGLRSGSNEVNRDFGDTNISEAVMLVPNASTRHFTLRRRT